MPETAYAQCGDLSLAYQVFGTGEVNLVLAGSFVSHVDLDVDPAQMTERARRELGDEYAPAPEKLAVLMAHWKAIQSRWGAGDAMRVLVPSISSKQLLGTLERMSASPGMARATIEAALQIDVRSVLSSISVPTLIIHAIDDAVPIELGRYLADHIPGSRMVEVAGRDHAPWFSDPDHIASVVEEFLTGASAPVSTTRRALRTLHLETSTTEPAR